MTIEKSENGTIICIIGEEDGDADGSDEGNSDKVGDEVGVRLGGPMGLSERCSVDGTGVGAEVGRDEGIGIGSVEGKLVGFNEGLFMGRSVGCVVGDDDVGLIVGSSVLQHPVLSATISPSTVA